MTRASPYLHTGNNQMFDVERERERAWEWDLNCLNLYHVWSAGCHGNSYWSSVVSETVTSASIIKMYCTLSTLYFMQIYTTLPHPCPRFLGKSQSEANSRSVLLYAFRSTWKNIACPDPMAWSLGMLYPWSQWSGNETRITGAHKKNPAFKNASSLDNYI